MLTPAVRGHIHLRQDPARIFAGRGLRDALNRTGQIFVARSPEYA